MKRYFKRFMLFVCVLTVFSLVLTACGNDDKPAETTEVPASSAETPASSVEEPASSVEEPASSVEEPASSVEEPASSVEEPASSVEEPASSDEEPASSVEEPASSVEEPASSVEEPASSDEEPASSDEEPASSVEEPESSVEEPASSVEEPASSVEEPASSDEEPASSVEEPASSVEEPASSVEEPESSVEEPESSVEEPASSDEEPASSVEEPASSVEEPESSVEEPASSVEEPESSVEEPASSVEEPESSGDEPTIEPTVPTLLLGDFDISDYVIIYETPAERSQMGAYWRDEYDSGKVTATRLAEMIQAKFGVELKVYRDKTRAVGSHEILIGKTNRTESSCDAVTALTDDDFYIGMQGEKLVICGGVAGSTYHALDNLEAYFATTVENSAYAIDESSELSGSYHLQRIAMLGDSITYGALATNYTTNGALLGYPNQVGRMYWQECTVTVYAQPGVCMRQDLSGFVTIQLWTNFKLDLVKKGYDIVLIMLGTNDSYTDTKTGDTWDGVWTDADDTAFLNSVELMAKTIKRYSPDTEMVLMNCPVYYRTAATHASHYHSSPRVLALQKQAALDLREKGYNIHFYDMNAYTTDNTTASQFPDLLHPGDEGHEIIAKGVVDMIKLLLEGKTDKYLIN